MVTTPEKAEKNRAEEVRGKRLAFLSLAALGVVYGDIGTSPLYAVRECFHGTYAIEVNRANILGVLSLILWALLIVVTVKYLSYILRADNRGEGGVIASCHAWRFRLRFWHLWGQSRRSGFRLEG